MNKTIWSVALVATMGAAACAGWLKQVDDVNDPSDDAKLAKCREEGRKAMHDTGNGDLAWQAYYDCTVDGGLR